jgi:hypothetical protein
VNLSNFIKERRDVYFWSNKEKEGEKIWKLFVIELCIPFGRGTEDINETTLKYINRYKMIKYKGLMDRLNSQLKNVKNDKIKYIAEFRTIVVSSLGAIPNFTINNLSAIIGCNGRSVMQLWAKRMVMAALKGSFILWLRGGSNMANQMQGKRKTIEKMEGKDMQLQLNEQYEEVQMLKINLRRMTELEMENGAFYLIENTQESLDTMITNLDRSNPEVMNNYDNVREMMMPKMNEVEMIENEEEMQGYIKEN